MNPSFAIKPTETKRTERDLQQNIRHLEVTGKVLASKVQKHAEAIDTIADTIRAPKRALEEVRRNPAPYEMILGGVLAIYGLVGLIGTWRARNSMR